MGERDQRYSQQFGRLTERLQATAKLNDLSTIRQSLVKNVAEIEKCVTKMTEDGQESVAALRAQMGVYEARLEEVEKGFTVAAYALSPKGLLEGLTSEQFEKRYGSVREERFRKEAASLLKKIRALPGYK